MVENGAYASVSAPAGAVVGLSIVQGGRLMRCTGEARLLNDGRQATATSCRGVRNRGTTMYMGMYPPLYIIWSPWLTECSSVQEDGMYVMSTVRSWAAIV